MQHTLAVRVIQRGPDVATDGQRPIRRNTVQFSGIRSIHILHGDPEPVLGDAAIVDLHDIGMVEVGRDIGFTLEPLPYLVVVGDLIALQDLQSREPG
nr:hypothetical protein [Nocardia tengchongensis]